MVVWYILFLLVGYTLFLAFVIDRLHHYLRKLMTLRKTSSTSREEVEKLQMENRSLREKDEKSSSEMKKLQRENAKLNESMKKLKSETEEHERKASVAEAHVNALQKQSEELLLEYDRLLEDNQILQTRLLSRGWAISWSMQLQLFISKSLTRWRQRAEDLPCFEWGMMWFLAPMLFLTYDLVGVRMQCVLVREFLFLLLFFLRHFNS